ncbi:MAG: cytochrome c4 [Pseudomonadota bacterium]|nr:cytochrome c4 [Pseudomonadota bacterium]
MGTAHAQTAAPAAGDPAKGEQKASMCIGCHGIEGYQASFPVVYKVPMISGQNAEYIVTALTEYKKGERKHPTMRAIAGSMTDADMADLAAFYHQEDAASIKPVADSPPAPPAAVEALLTKGACASCHGANYSKPISPAYPKLAGQHGDYLYMALRSYKTEGNPNLGRANAIMGAQVKQFSLQELKTIGEYLSTLPSELRVVPQSRFISH